MDTLAVLTTKHPTPKLKNSLRAQSALFDSNVAIIRSDYHFKVCFSFGMGFFTSVVCQVALYL